MPNRYKFHSGHYIASYAGVDIGTTQEGFYIRERIHSEPIPVDESGVVPVDAINMGVEYAIEMRNFVEYSKVKAAMHKSSGGALGAGLTSVGTLQSANAAVLVLTPFDTTNNKTYTASFAIVEGDVEIKLATGLRKGSLTFICYPDPTQSTNALAKAIVESGGASE